MVDCKVCGQEVVFDRWTRTYWFKNPSNPKEGREGTCWRHRNGGLFDNRTNCCNPTPDFEKERRKNQV